MLRQLCHLCASPAGHTCRFCGRQVCPDHYEARRGACTQCAQGVRA